jgi:DNA-binding MarR family transcriptional regulator
MTATSQHLRAFSALLARDDEISRLHHRHLQLLAFCCEATAAQRIETIAEAVGLSRSGASRAIDKLLAHGLLDRASDAENRRILWISATQQGHALNQRVRRHYEDARPRPVLRRAQPAA